jgi:UDP-glucose 4-epimerase
MKYVVTGGAGFIGKNIVKLLIRQNHEVEVVDNLHSGKISNLEEIKDQIKFHDCNILDFKKMEEICKDVDGVFHQAALTVVQESYTKKEEYYRVNVKGTENIFSLAKKYNFKVVFASSSSIYGNTNSIPIKENFDRNPINPYGQTKLEDEYLAEKFWGMGVNIIGLRYFNVFGKDQNISYAGVITKFLDRILKNKSPLIFGIGNQIRDFVFVEDVAQANIHAMKSDVKKGFFNVGSGTIISIKEIAEHMLKITKNDMEPTYLDPLEGDILQSQADIQNVKNDLNWLPKKELREWLDETIPQLKR